MLIKEKLIMKSSIVICPKCGYERQPKDDEYKIIPETECPKCGIIYDKWTVLADEKTTNIQPEENIPQIKSSKFTINKSSINAALFIFSVLVVVAFIISHYSKGSLPNKSQQINKTDKSATLNSTDISNTTSSAETDSTATSSSVQSTAAVSDVSSQQVAQDLPTLYKTVAPSVVLISTDKGYGTGFFINNGNIVTNNHVIAGASQIKIKTQDNKEYVVNQPIAKDTTNDLAILSAAAHQGEIRSLVISPTLPEVGEKIFVVSNPSGTRNTIFEKSLSEGLISATRAGSPDLFQITAPISPGSSGGPVFNMKGEVVCVVKSTESILRPNTPKISQNLNFCIPVEKVMALLRGEAPVQTQIAAVNVYCSLMDDGSVIITTNPKKVVDGILISNRDGSLDKATYEEWVFAKIGGNPIVFDPNRAAQLSLNGEREQLFKNLFPDKRWGDGLSAEQLQAWYIVTNQYRYEQYIRATEWKNKALHRYKYMMDVFNRYSQGN